MEIVKITPHNAWSDASDDDYPGDVCNACAYEDDNAPKMPGRAMESLPAYYGTRRRGVNFERKLHT